MHIGDRQIGGAAPCYIIAEVGINHGGDEELCRAMILAAAAAGADAVKLQTVTAEHSYHPDTLSYQLFKHCGLDAAALRRLMAVAAEAGIHLFSTPGDPAALALMLEVGMPAIKISSGLLTNTAVLRRAAATGLPLILSTGMATWDEIEAAVAEVRAAGVRDLAVLQCTAIYPAPADSLNLAVMAAIAQSTGAVVGYSDHYDGALACVAAVAMGAKVIEKHFTTDRTLPGGDNAVSMEPAPFAAMVADIRTVEAMRGAALRKPDATELPLRDGRYRKLVPARPLDAGTVIGEDDLHLMRMPPGVGGLVANQVDKVVGRRLARAVTPLVVLTEEDLCP